MTPLVSLLRDPLTLIFIGLSLAFTFMNGFHDSSNIVAPMISSRALPPQIALAWTALAEFSGPFIFGVAVATTIGADIVSADKITMWVLIAALLGAIFWDLFTWWIGIPSSSSHALVGGTIGAVSIGAGLETIHYGGLEKILLALFISPLIGFGVGYLLVMLIYFLARGASPRINKQLKHWQILTALLLGWSHGTNDGQKTMGLMALGLLNAHYLTTFSVPLWVVIINALAIASGTFSGGWRLIRTLGGKFYKIRPIHGFAVEMTSALVILSASLFGGPVSTTQVVGTAIMGVGASERFSKVRWHVARDIALTWILTIPVTALVAALAYLALGWVFSF